MYLSRLILNPRNRLVQKDLSDCQDLHRTILKAFPQADKVDTGARAQFGILYRLENNNHSGQVTVLVQSKLLPNWQAIASIPGYLLETSQLQNPSCKPIANLYQQLKLGSHLIFRLRANPTRKTKVQSNNTEQAKQSSKRVEIYKESDQLAWLHRKATQGGFRLLSLKLGKDLANLQVQPTAKDIGWRKNGNESQKLTFGAVLFQGELEITNLEKFQQTLINGIGSGKSYGFGLLSIAANTIS